jgi:hypothetical protein
MLDSKLLSILRKLSSRDRTRFRDYVNSPFFNKHSGLINLCDYILDFAPLFNHEKLEQKAAFEAIFPKDKFSEQHIYTLVSNLLELMNGFLAQIEFENSPLVQKRYTMTALRKLKEQRQWHSVKKQYEIIRSKQTENNSSSSLIEIKLFYDELDANFISKQLREADPNLQLSSDLLDKYYFAEKLRTACDIYSRNTVINAAYNSFELIEILKIIDRNLDIFSETAAILVYRSILEMLSNDGVYHKTIAVIKENEQHFSTEELKTQFDYVINFVIRKLNSGEPNWHREFLELHRYLLEKDILLSNGKLPEWDFKNIVTVALRAGETAWVEKFIIDYKNILPEDVKENAYCYNMAAYFHSAGRYEDAMQMLQEVNFTDESYQLGSKIILLKSYYEIGEYEAGMSLIISFRRHIERSKTLSDYRKLSNLNMLYVAKKLFKFQEEFEYKSTSKLRKQLKSIEISMNNKHPMANTDWIGQKLNSLKKDMNL